MRYKPGMSRLVQEDDVGSGLEYTHSEIDLDAPINFEILKAQIEIKGPLISSNHAHGVQHQLQITPCSIENCQYCEEVISLTQVSGFSTLQTLIDKDRFDLRP